MAKQPTKSFDITDDIVIPCPMHGFGLRRANKCLSCEHYGGMAQASHNGEPIESDDPVIGLQVICNRPITRRMQRIVLE